MVFNSLFQLPSVTDLFDSIATTSKPAFEYIMPTVSYGLGILVGALILIWLVSLIWNFASGLFGSKRDEDKDWETARTQAWYEGMTDYLKKFK